MDRIDTSRVDLAALTLKDAVDLAILIEDEARDRYREFSRLVGGRFPNDADDVFRTMCELEEKHRRVLADRRRTVFGEAPARFDASVLYDLEAPDPGAVRVFMGPQDALRVALEAETRAVEFYDEAARTVKDPAAKVFLEEQRAEEADHCRALEAWMRAVPPGPDVLDDEADPPGSDAG